MSPSFALYETLQRVLLTVCHTGKGIINSMMHPFLEWREKRVCAWIPCWDVILHLCRG